LNRVLVLLMVLLWSCFCSEFFGAEDVARKWHSPRRAEVTIAACSGGQAGERRKAGQPEAVARRPGVAAARASKGNGSVACTTSSLLLLLLLVVALDPRQHQAGQLLTAAAAQVQPIRGSSPTCSGSRAKARPGPGRQQLLS